MCTYYCPVKYCRRGWHSRNFKLFLQEKVRMTHNLIHPIVKNKDVSTDIQSCESPAHVS